MNRRSFIGAALAACAAPAIVRASSIMPVRALAPAYVADPLGGWAWIGDDRAASYGGMYWADLGLGHGSGTHIILPPMPCAQDMAIYFDQARNMWLPVPYLQHRAGANAAEAFQ